MSKSQHIRHFDPNGIGQQNGHIFGLPFDYREAQIILLPVPWEATTSYGSGTSDGPAAILKASPQIDLFDFDLPEAWKMGYHMLPIDNFWEAKNRYMKNLASQYIDFLEKGGSVEENPEMRQSLKDINSSSHDLMLWVEDRANTVLKEDKLIAVVGGDHSVPLGLMKALARKHHDFGILQIDAHADLRVAYEGFDYSHASIMHNALQLPQITKLVSVGVRDLCEAEVQAAVDSNGRILPFYGQTLRYAQLSESGGFFHMAQNIIQSLPDKVYVSFDIDGLDPKLCPNTGTPVPDGLELAEAFFLLNTLVNSGRTIIGFDLCEVGPGENEWDANVGARVLYKLCNLMAKSNDLKPHSI